MTSTWKGIVSHLHVDACVPCTDQECEHLICEHGEDGTGPCTKCPCITFLAANDCRRCRGGGWDPVHTFRGASGTELGEPCYLCHGTGNRQRERVRTRKGKL